MSLHELKYGHQTRILEIPDRNLLGVLEPSAGAPLTDLAAELRTQLMTPTSGPALADLIASRKPRTAVIIVNDMTRSTPSDVLLLPLLETFERNGLPRSSVTIVVAAGTHRQMSADECRTLVGDEVFRTCRVICHDCDAPDLVDMGTMSTGNHLMINPIVAKADLRVAIGEVLLHFYAGFAGGRKSIFPGVAGRQTIMTNHARMVLPGADLGSVDNNPVSDEMVEALQFCPLHFIVNCVSDSHKRIVHLVTGDAVKAWHYGIELFQRYNFAKIGCLADVVFLSAGGYPKDINMYQAHKVLFSGSRAVRPGGTVILLAELSEGYGHPVFQQWAEKDLSLEQVISAFNEHFLFGLHKLFYLAKLRQQKKILLYSSVSAQDSRRMFCDKVENLREILPYLTTQYGPNFTSYVIPQAGIVLPLLMQ